MKSKLAVILGATLLAGSAFAQTNQVLSRNAVGYVRLDFIATNKLHMVANNFVPLDSPIAISNTFATLPPGTQIILWNEGSQTYLPPIVRGPFGWPAAASNVLPRGKSFFLKTSSSASNVTQYSVYVMGEVPDRITAPTTSVSAAKGFTFASHPYPVTTFWTNTALAKAMLPGSQLILWDAASQSYPAPFIKGPFGWSGAANSLMITAGQGVLIKTTNTFSYSEIKPYTWP